MPRPRTIPPHHPTDRLIGQALTIQALRSQIRHLSSFDGIGNAYVPTVVLHGETGTGKGLVARVLHDSGPRARGPFIDVNCAAIPETMLEAELFGFEAGAFTDAKRAKAGLFEAASGGTLVLDEIDALPVVLQSKLLKIIEEKRLRRLGAVADNAVDVKLIAATSADLNTRVADGRFRLDLYHRLAVVLLEFPPLRARGEDILMLARQFLQQYATGHRAPPKRLNPSAEAWLLRYVWPGNVRELSHLMERVTLLHPEDVIEANALEQFRLPRSSGETVPGVEQPTTEATNRDELTRIRQALMRTGGNVVRAAQLLGLRRDALRYRMRRHGIRPLTLADLTQATVSQPIVPLIVNAGPPAGWERKLVAVLATDLTWPDASTVEGLPYEPWTVTARWEQMIVKKVEGFGGVPLPHAPSLLLFAFGLPQTLEQLPQRAVHAALALQELAGDESPLAEEGPRPALRLGLHWGPVLVATQARDTSTRVLAVGDTLAVPVRLSGQAAHGEVLTSPSMGRLIEGWCALQPRAGIAGPGLDESLGISAIVRAQSGVERLAAQASRRGLRFVGRTREMAILTELWAHTQDGSGQVVGIAGEPGVGKSRLLAEFICACQPTSVRLLETWSSAYTQTMPYRPIIDLLRSYFSLDDRDDGPMLREKVTRQLACLDLPRALVLSPLLTLLEGPLDDPIWQIMDPSQRRQRILDAIRHILIRQSEVQPLFVVCEDLHWIDTETQAILDRMIESLPTARILLLVTYRPEYQHPWGGKTYYTQLRLDPLPPTGVEAFVQVLLGDDPSLAPLTRLLCEQTGGNPFFLEESVQTLIETGVLVGEPGGYHLVHPYSRLQVPTTVQAVLAARLDRLARPDQELLRLLSVLGHESSLRLITEVAGEPEAAVRQRLTHLQCAEFVDERRGRPEPVYTFKHALTQEVASQAGPTHMRHQSHRRVAQVLEARYPETCETQPERLAHHYTEAGLIAQAIPYWQRAGQRALERSASVEAMGHLTKGLALLRILPATPDHLQQDLALQAALGRALMATDGHTAPEVEQVYVRARELCEQVGDTAPLSSVLWGLWYWYVSRAELQTAREFGEELLSVAQVLHDSGLLLLAHRAL